MAKLLQTDARCDLAALRNVAEARSFTKLAECSNLNRENLYRMLGADGNPTVQSLAALLKPLGLGLSVEAEGAVREDSQLSVPMV